MENTGFEKVIRFLVYTVGIALIIAAFSSLVAAFRSPEFIFVGWVSITFQVLLVIGGIVLSLAISFSALLGVRFVWALLDAKIIDLERRFSEELRKIRKNTPTFVAGLVIIANATLLIADKSFSGDTLVTISVSLLMLLIFSIANILATHSKTLERIIGYFLYSLGIVILPIFALVYHNWEIVSAVRVLAALDLSTKLVLGISVIIYISLPFLAHSYYSKS
jgi:hypothetical protein